MQLKQYDVVIALDGGANHCQKMKLKPDYSIGDGDSIFIQSKTFLHDPNQNTTDLQKGLALCKKIAGKKKYIIDLFCCASENRLDHTQAALQALMYLSNIRQLHTSTATIQYLTAKQSLQLTKLNNRMASLIAVSRSAKVTLTGFAWSGTITFNQYHSGISNTINRSPAHVTLLTGNILLYINKRHKPREFMPSGPSLIVS